MQVKDAMTQRGFKGFFDIDSLKDINREALQQHVEETCCIVRSAWSRVLGGADRYRKKTSLYNSPCPTTDPHL